MKKIGLFIFCIICAIQLEAQSTSTCDSLADVFMASYEDIKDERDDKDTVFSFKYYKDNAYVDFYLVMSDKPVFKRFVGNSKSGKLVDVNHKYLSEAIKLFKRYYQWHNSQWDKETRKPIILPPPPGISADSISKAYRKSHFCNGYAAIECWYTNGGIQSGRPDEVISLIKGQDIVADKLYNDLIAFARKIK